VQVGYADDAEHITQAALLRLHHGLSRFRYGSRLSTCCQGAALTTPA
jgi:DNA-directed RNA polymerase specialized sigma24 family protein